MKFMNTTWIESWWNKLTQEETNELIVKAQGGDKEALGVLVEENIRLVGLVAKKINVGRRTEDYDGTIAEGVIALIKAIYGFDVSMGYRISTYACRGINTAMNNYITDGHASYSPVRISRRYSNLLASVKSFEEEFIKEHMRKPTIYEISKGINESIKDVKMVLRSKSGVLSLDNSPGDNETSFVDILVDTKAEYEDNVINKILISQYICELKEKEQKILKMKYYQDMTLMAIAEELEMTVNGAKLLEKRALSKLRKLIMGSDFKYETSVDFKKRA